MLSAPHLRSGFTLIEVLISLALGCLLLAMVIGLYVTNVATSNKGFTLSRLRTDLQALVSIMEGDIRRAGSGGSNFMVGAAKNKLLDSVSSNSQECIVYSYNYNNAVTAIASHIMGFRYSFNTHSIQFGRGLDVEAANCYSSGSWVNLTDPNFLKVTELKFVESIASNAQATMRSVEIKVSAELIANSDYNHQITTQVQVRNPELN